MPNAAGNLHGPTWAEWRPTYEAIAERLGLDPDADRAAADRLLECLPAERRVGLDALARVADGADALVLGNAAGLARMLPRVLDEDHAVVVACGAATDRAVHAGVWPAVVVTDLDGDAALQRRAAERGALTCIAAHGDNVDLIERHAPDWPGPVVPTCQTEPHGGLVNAGGFTDGDRALHLLQAAGAASARLVGFDLRHPNPDTPAKAAKLDVARALIAGLGIHIEPYKPGR